VPKVYIEFNHIGILHRTNEVRQPRWRQDNVYKLILGTRGAVSYETPRPRLNVRKGQFLLINLEDKRQQLPCDGDKFLFEFVPELVNEVTREMMNASAVDVRFRQ
jgi:hypothetical protein